MIPLLLPPATIGIIGGGQLGMMAVREAQRMGYRSIIWDPDPGCPASRLADETIVAPFSDRAAASRIATAADVLTYEFEHIDAAAVRGIEHRKPLFPGSRMLSISQHRLEEKAELQRHGFPVAAYAPAGKHRPLSDALDLVGLPAVVKTATAGYDGKGQTILRSDDEARTFLASAGSLTGDLVVEEFLPLRCELSVMVARGGNGEVRTFPVAENEHRENILHTTQVPSNLPASLLESATDLAQRVISAFEMTGLLCVEMFLTADGRLLVNELAPRPHNSGHYTLDACDCSQFELLVRVLCGLPLPEPRLCSPCAMVNLLGKHLQRTTADRLLAIPGVKLHLYGKTRLELKRKMGHVTILASTPDEVRNRMESVKKLIGE